MGAQSAQPVLPFSARDRHKDWRARSGILKSATSPGLGNVDILGEDALHDLDESVKGAGVVHRELSERTTASLDAGKTEALDEVVIGHPLRTQSSIDTLDPEATEIVLAGLVVTVGVDEGANDLLLGLAIQVQALTTVAEGLSEDGTALLLGINRTLGTCHVSVLLSVPVACRGAV